MSDSSPGAGSCCPLGRSGLAIVALVVATAVTTTGWVVTATTHARSAPVPTPAPEATARAPEMIFVPVIVPVAASVQEPTPPEMVEILVASKDLPVGTIFTRDDLKAFVKTKKASRDNLPQARVTDPEEFVDKRLSRPVRAEETFTPQDLVKGGGITLPDGYDMVSLEIRPAAAAAGFVGPGSKVNVITTARIGDKLEAFPLLVNVLVVAVDTVTVLNKDNPNDSIHAVSFAVTQKQALLLSLAKARGCTLELMLRHPTKSAQEDIDYNIDTVIKLLADEKTRGGSSEPKKPDNEGEARKPDDAPELAPVPRPVR